jgi:hypothetical protein
MEETMRSTKKICLLLVAAAALAIPTPLDPSASTAFTNLAAQGGNPPAAAVRNLEDMKVLIADGGAPAPPPLPIPWLSIVQLFV